jgi:multimeric flavodoxin WrbA
MKVTAFNASQRENGNTRILITKVFDEIQKDKIDTEIISLSGKIISGCTACYKCIENKDMKCIIRNDMINDCIKSMIESDCIILASPTYFTDVTSNMKSLIDRAGMVGNANGKMYKRKAGASIVSVRRGGAIHAFDTMNHFFLISEMLIVGSSYWNIGIGRNIGDVLQDEEGLTTMSNLGKNISWLLEKMK